MSDCPTPHKPAFPNPQQAWSAAHTVKDRAHYHCPCGAWHTGSEKGKGLKPSRRWTRRRGGRKIGSLEPLDRGLPPAPD